MPKSEGGSSWSVRPLHHLKDHRDPVDVMAWSPDGSTLVTGADKGLYIWNTRVSSSFRRPMDELTISQDGTQRPITGSSTHNDQISAIQWTPDGSEFLVTSMDCRLVFYVREAVFLHGSAHQAADLANAESSRPCQPAMELQPSSNQRFRHDARRHSNYSGHDLTQACPNREQAEAESLHAALGNAARKYRRIGRRCR